MDEIRFQRVENEVTRQGVQLEEHAALHREHDRRFTDQGHIIGGHAAQLQAQAELLRALQKSIDVQNKMIKVAEDLLEACGTLANALAPLGRGARWFLSVAGAITLIVGWLKGWFR